MRAYCGILYTAWFAKVCMALSYEKLWKLQIGIDMKKEDLCIAAGYTPTAIAELGPNEYVSTKVLLKIYNFFDCDIADIMKIVGSHEG